MERWQLVPSALSERATMRGFVLITCSVLLAIGIGVAAIAAGSVPSGETTAASFALRVLREAGIPPHARLTTKDVSGSLGRVFETPGVVGLIDVHRFYLVNELAGTVESYVGARGPKGGWSLPSSAWAPS